MSDLGVVRDYITVAAVDTSTSMDFEGIGTTDTLGEQEIHLNMRFSRYHECVFRFGDAQESGHRMGADAYPEQ